MVILLILLGLFIIIVFVNSINTNEKKKQYEKEQELSRKFSPKIIDKTVWKNGIKKIDIDKNIETENSINTSNNSKILPTNTLSHIVKPYQTTEYLHPLWKERREQIIGKDRYTCKKCGKFNPAAGMIINYISTDIWGYDNFLFDYECHEYDIYKNIYHYHFGEIYLDIEFGEHKLIMPELHVHHKKYIEGRKLWEYEDNDLETLCFECHKEKHRQSKIPIYNFNNQIINYVEKKDITNPNYIRNPLRDFPSWTFVHKKENTYEASKEEDIRPTLSGVILGDFSVNSDRELNKELNEKLIAFYVKFMRKYIPNFI